jgi:phasin family protein
MTMATTRKTAKKAAGATARKTSRAAAGSPAAAAASAGADKASAKLFGDLGKLAEKIKLPGIDVAAIVESQRKDMEALAEANKQAYEGIKALAQRRNEILQEALVEWQEAMRDAGGKDALAKGAERAKRGVQQAIANFKELADMEAKSRSKAWKIVQDRFQENLANLQKLLQPPK